MDWQIDIFKKWSEMWRENKITCSEVWQKNSKERVEWNSSLIYIDKHMKGKIFIDLLKKI